MRHRIWVVVAGLIVSGFVVSRPFGSVLVAQGETFSATATVKTAGGTSATAPVVVDALKKGGTAAVMLTNVRVKN